MTLILLSIPKYLFVICFHYIHGIHYRVYFEIEHDLILIEKCFICEVTSDLLITENLFGK